MLPKEYFGNIQQAVLDSPYVLQNTLSFDQISEREGYLKGTLNLTHGYSLHIAEYVQTHPVLEIQKYRYHLQDSEDTLIARWDNAPHHRELEGFPNHVHTSDGSICVSDPMTLIKVLDALGSILPES